MQLAGHPGLNAYPPTLESLPPEDVNSPLTRLAVSVHVLPTVSGPLTLPPLALPWFNPADGRLHKLTLPGRVVAIHDPRRVYLLWAGLGLLGLVALGLAGHYARRALAWRQARRRSLAAIAVASDLPSLLAAVRAFSLIPDQPPATTLGHWRATRSLSCAGLDALLAALDAAGYGTYPADLERLRARVIRTLGRAKRG